MAVNSPQNAAFSARGWLRIGWVYLLPIALFLLAEATWVKPLGKFGLGIAQTLTATDQSDVFSGTVQLAPGAPGLRTPQHGRPAAAVELVIRHYVNHRASTVRVLDDFRAVPFILKTPQGSYTVSQRFASIEPTHDARVLVDEGAMPKWAIAWEAGHVNLNLAGKYDVLLSTVCPGQSVTIIGRLAHVGTRTTLVPAPQGYHLLAGSRAALTARILRGRQQLLAWSVGLGVWLVGLVLLRFLK